MVKSTAKYRPLEVLCLKQTFQISSYDCKISASRKKVVIGAITAVTIAGAVALTGGEQQHPC